jgi:hypothetical protein
MKKWKTIEDKNVQHFWKCENDNCEEDFENEDQEPNQEVSVFPTFYQESGEPLCPRCGDEMVYQRTEVKMQVYPLNVCV